MPRVRSLLLTFDQLTPEAITKTSGAVTLSQHYLRYPGAASITGAEDGTVEARRKFRLIAIGDEPPDNATCLGSLKPDPCPFDDALPFLEQELTSDDSSLQVLWIHIQNQKSSSSDLTEQFLQVIRTKRPPECLLAVTAFEQPQLEIDHSFEILVHENRLRVPGSVEHPSFATFHSQAITSSADLLHTLSQHAERKTDPAAIPRMTDVSQPEQGPRDLTQILANPGIPWRRRLKVELDNVRALRDGDFLYVAETDPDSDSTVVVSEALFVKPQDRWNVHDVSSEYLEMTDTMRQQLGLN